MNLASQKVKLLRLSPTEFAATAGWIAHDQTLRTLLTFKLTGVTRPMIEREPKPRVRVNALKRTAVGRLLTSEGLGVAIAAAQHRRTFGSTGRFNSVPLAERFRSAALTRCSSRAPGFQRASRRGPCSAPHDGMIAGHSDVLE